MTQRVQSTPVAADPLRSRSPIDRGRPWLSWLMIVAASVVIVNGLIGIFPLSAFEGDDQGIINGLREYIRGPAGFPALAYTPVLQPGAYHCVLLLHKISGADVGQLFFLVSALSAAGFALGAAMLGSRLLRIPFTWSLLATVLAQETVTAAAYANTSTVGGCAVLAGLLVLELWPGHPLAVVGAAACIALGGWCRLDALALAPLAPVILRRHNCWRTTLSRTTAVAILSVTTLGMLLAVSGVTPIAIWQTFAAKPQTGSVLHIIEWLYLLHSATGLILAVIGMVWATWRKDFVVLAALAAVFCPLLLIHGRSLDTTKYLYYGVPPITWAALWTIARLARHDTGRAANTLIRWRHAALAAIGCCIVLEYGTALQRKNNPVRRFGPGAKIVLANIPLRHGTMTWAIGPGDAILTGDGFRVRGGYGFAPWMWHSEKLRVLDQAARLQRWVSAHDHATIITSTYFAYQAVVGALRAESFTPGRIDRPDAANPTTTRAVWQCGPRVFTVILVNHSDERQVEFRELSHASRDPAVLFVNDMGRQYARSLLLASGQRWRALSPSEDGELTLYEREVQERANHAAEVACGSPLAVFNAALPPRSPTGNSDGPPRRSSK